jgi:hypothetical protein
MDDLDATQAYSRNLSNWENSSNDYCVLIEEEMASNQRQYVDSKRNIRAGIIKKMPLVAKVEIESF